MLVIERPGRWGGELEVSWPGAGPVIMIGPAVKVFSGLLASEMFADAA